MLTKYVAPSTVVKALTRTPEGGNSTDGPVTLTSVPPNRPQRSCSAVLSQSPPPPPPPPPPGAPTATPSVRTPVPILLTISTSCTPSGVFLWSVATICVSLQLVIFAFFPPITTLPFFVPKSVPSIVTLSPGPGVGGVTRYGAPTISVTVPGPVCGSPPGGVTTSPYSPAAPLNVRTSCAVICESR